MGTASIDRQCMQQWFKLLKSSEPAGDLNLLKKRKLSLVILFLFSMNTWFPNDDRHGKNRHRNFYFESEEEKKIFNEIRSLQSNLLRSQSHLTFFAKCQEQGLHPVILKYNNNFNVAFADGSITSKLKGNDGQNIAEKISLCINHFKLKTSRLKEEITISMSQLRRISNENRFITLSEKLDQFAKKKKSTLAKKRKKRSCSNFSVLVKH